MSISRGSVHRWSAAVLVALAMLLVAGPGAQAANISTIKNAKADAQALHIVLNIPSSDALKATLKAIGVDVSAVPDGLTTAQTLEIAVSKDHGAVTLAGATGSSTVLAVSLNGQPLDQMNVSVSSSCEKASCAGKAAVAEQTVPLPNDIGYVTLTGAKSDSTSKTSTLNETALVKVHIDLQPLFKGTLAPLAGPVTQATDTVNTSVLPPVNGALDTIEKALPTTEPIPGVKLGTIRNLPSPATVPLLDLTVLPGGATIKNGIVAEATAQIEDLSVLGGWLNMKTVTATAMASTSKSVPTDLNAAVTAIAKRARTDLAGAQAMAADVNRQLAADKKKLPSAKAASDLVLGGGSLAGLATVDANKLLAGFAGIAPIVNNLVPDAAPDVKAELIAAATLADQIAGISISRVAGDKGTITTEKTPEQQIKVERIGRNIRVGLSDEDAVASAFSAHAESDQMVLNVAPNLPKLDALAAKAGVVPALSKSDFVASGIVLRVEMPKASAQLGNTTEVLGVAFARTGVGSHVMLAVLLIGAAVLVKKFAFTK